MGIPHKVAGDLRERLAAVMETAGELQQNQSELMRMMRQTLAEIRALRQRMLSPVHDGANTAPTVGTRLAKKFHLTPRELEVAMLLSSGAPNTAIARALNISEHTARHHTRHVLVKLGLHSRAKAAAIIARELGVGAARFP
jgi:DNA-binding NarL/FixJ family response regulator